MAKSSSVVPFATAAVDHASQVPLYRQLYEKLRAGILSGQLAPGTRLPSTREMAADVGVSRNTVMNAFEQLLAEGYVEGHIGSGTFVSPALPDDLLTARANLKRSAVTLCRGRALSQREMALAATAGAVCGPATDGIRPFRTGMPALDAFPFEAWSKIVTRYWRRPQRDLLGYGDPAGYRPLREAIATYLGAARAVRCAPEQVIVVAGTQQAIDLVARVLLDPGDAVWVEDYGYPAAHSALAAAGARTRRTVFARRRSGGRRGLHRGGPLRASHSAHACTLRGTAGRDCR